MPDGGQSFEVFDYCDNCGRSFPATIELGPGVIEAVVTDNTSRPCPACCVGRVSQAQGASGFVHEGVRLILASGVTEADIRVLADALARAQESSGDPDPDGLKKQLADSPEQIKRLVDLLPKTKMEYYTAIGLLLMAIAAFFAGAQYMQARDPSESDVRRVVKELLDQTQHMGSTPTDVQAGTPRHRPGREDPCWCGSRKKYKRCHGRPRR